jgi:hypothetical protein
VHAGGSDGGINVIGGDTDGNGDGLINVHTEALSGVTGDTLDGTNVDVVNSDSLVDARAPGLLDATVGDGTVADVIDGLGDGGDLGSLGGLAGGLQGIRVDALNGDSLAEVHAPGIADAVVGAGLGGGVDLLGVTDGLGLAGDQGLNVQVLNGDYLAEAHAPGDTDITVGGAELGNLMGGAELGGLSGDVPIDAGGLVSDILGGTAAGDLAGLDLGHTLDSVTG